MQGTQEGEEHGSCSGNCMREMDLIWDDIWCSLTGGNVWGWPAGCLSSCFWSISPS